MFFKNTHKTLFRNIFIGGIIMAILAGTVATVIEFKRVDRYLAQITPGEAQKISQYYEVFYQNRNRSSLSDLKQATKNSLDPNLFVYVEFLDDKLKKVVQVSINEFNQIIPELNKKFGEFQMSGRFNHKTLYHNGRIYIKVMVPIIREKTNEHIGHFQGIYHLSDVKLDNIKKQSLYSILITVIAVLCTSIFIYPIIHSLHKTLFLQSFELLKSNTDILKSFGSAISERDSDTNSHNYRVTIYSVKLAEKIGLNPKQIQALIKGALLHDIGKIGISDSILRKPGKLSSKEFETMKQHVAIGYKIIKQNGWLQDALDVVRFHHERFDGTGYLLGKTGKSIPVNARIFAIADVFDALTSERSYKKPFPLEKSLNIMRDDSGKHFDPEYYKAFEKIVAGLYQEIRSYETEAQLNNHLNSIFKQYFNIL